MAIYNGRILMRRGLEADFDASKLMSGEWALSTDEGIVRICLEAGTVIRMATYEAFEEDMRQIEAILLECQTIEEAIERINAEIDLKAQAIIEYAGQAKTYRDEALQFRNEAEAFKNQAGEIADIGIATTEKAGIVKPDGVTTEVLQDGTLRVIGGGGGGTSNYDDLTNKPKINGVELNGNKTTADLGIEEGTTDYTELNNKPKINGVEITGELTTEDLNIIAGTVDYTYLQNKPTINGVEISGDLTSDDLNIKAGDNAVYLTQAEYDALPDSKLADGVEYRITDAGTDSISASNVGYDNSFSGIEAVTVQQAVDKLIDSLKYSALTYNEETDYFGLYYGGVWRDVIKANLQPIYLYKNGTEYVTWGSNATYYSGFTSAGSFTKRNDGFYADKSNTTTSNCFTINTTSMFDFTPYKNLIIDYKVDGVSKSVTTDVSSFTSLYLGIFWGKSAYEATLKNSLSTMHSSSAKIIGLEKDATTILIERIYVVE